MKVSDKIVISVTINIAQQTDLCYTNSIHDGKWYTYGDCKAKYSGDLNKHQQYIHEGLK